MSRSRKVFWYINKHFLKYFGLVAIGIILLALILNLFDVIDKAKSLPEISWKTILKMAFLQVPPFLEKISIFLILLSSMITLFNLSSRSEITIMRSSGMSLWQIIMPIIISSFIIGFIFITAWNLLSIYSAKEYNNLEKIYIKKDQDDLLEPKGGIWLKQQNITKTDERIIIRAKKIYKNSIELYEANFWLLGNQGEFYKKIDTKIASLKNGYWELTGVTINDDDIVNKQLDQITIATNLDKEFIVKKIINNFEDPDLFSIFELPKLISDLEESGFLSKKFQVYFYSLLNKPILFTSMVMLAAFFSINNSRNKNNIIFLVFAIMIGLLIYISLSIIAAFGGSGAIPTWISTWLVSAILLAVTVLMIFKKETV